MNAAGKNVPLLQHKIQRRLDMDHDQENAVKKEFVKIAATHS
jgi:hypothetical protein